MRKLPTAADARTKDQSRDHHGRDLFRNLVAGGASSIVKALLQLAMLPVMGRLLGPREFGLYATVLPVITFFTVIADGGLGASLAKERSSDRTVWDTAFWVMLVLGVTLASLVNLCGLGLAAFMHEPRLVGLMSVLSVSFLFIALSTLPSARLFQRNDLVSYSAVDTIATFVGAGTAIAFAWSGFGALSLAVQSVTTFGVRAAGLNLLAFELPGRSVSPRTLVSHLNTGGVLVGTRLVDMVCRFAENILFSLSFGPAALGSYTFANQVSRFLCESASNPVWSATYAQTLKLNGRPVAGLICGMARLMLLATFPAACVVAVSAPAMLPLLLGAKWQHAGGFLQVLICFYSFAAAASVGSAVLLASGHNRLFLGTAALLSVGRVVAVAAGHWLGAVEVVAAIAVAHLVYAGVMAGLVARIYAVERVHLVAAVATPLFAGAVGALACLCVLEALPRSDLATIAALLLGGAAFLATLVTIDKDFTPAGIKRSLDRARGSVEDIVAADRNSQRHPSNS